jgi:2-dehydro-3-deoxy-D-arabinonate dehydratase
MKLVKFQSDALGIAVGELQGDEVVPLWAASGPLQMLEVILESETPRQDAERRRKLDAKLSLSQVRLLAPIDLQEVWAAGVTYRRSQTARMEESAAAASCYDRVYQSPRPELFLKATPHRVSGPGQPLRIRADAEWNVPEPELALVLNSRLELVGFTIGNDMSSRDIEGDNPLYLPQAKVYDQCCGLGPCIRLAEGMPPRKEIGIRLVIDRARRTVFRGETSIAEMARTFEDLIGWLGRDNSFPHGAFLLTGTGIVPDSDFTLEPDDIVTISIDGIGELKNPVVQAEPRAEDERGER